jgi:hypothetical protein
MPVDMQEASQGRSGINSVIDGRLGLEALTESETDSDGE